MTIKKIKHKTKKTAQKKPAVYKREIPEADDRDEMHYDEEFERTLLEDILEFVKTFLLLSVIIVIISFFIIKPAVVSGSSMMPLLKNGQKGFSNILTLALKGLNRGDIVVARASLEDGTTAEIVKRVIGLPGETIWCKDNVIYIDGNPLDESGWLNSGFVREFTNTYGYFTENFGPITLKDHEYFLLGDNRPVSMDSRDFGPFHSKDILSKDFFTLYPLDKFGFYA